MHIYYSFHVYTGITRIKEEKHRYYFKSVTGKMVQPLGNSLMGSYKTVFAITAQATTRTFGHLAQKK